MGEFSWVLKMNLNKTTMGEFFVGLQIWSTRQLEEEEEDDKFRGFENENAAVLKMKKRINFMGFRGVLDEEEEE